MENTPDKTILWIKENLSTDTPLRDMYLKNKNQIFVMWAEALEAKIKNGSTDIPLNKVGRHIRRELLEMNLEQAIVYMYEVLPSKFKHVADEIQDDMEKVGNPTEYSSSHSYDCSMDNKSLLTIANDLKGIATNLINYLEFTEVEPNCPPEWLTSVRKMTDAVIEKAKYTADGREKLCKLDQVLTLNLANSCTLNSIYDELTAQKMKQSTITSKQMGKIVTMKIKDAFETLRPRTEVQAISVGWTGLPCAKCGEYRVERAYHSDVDNFEDHCVTCDNWQKMALSPTLPNL